MSMGNLQLVISGPIHITHEKSTICCCISDSVSGGEKNMASRDQVMWYGFKWCVYSVSAAAAAVCVCVCVHVRLSSGLRVHFRERLYVINIFEM
jgi:hypothetical protein